MRPSHKHFLTTTILACAASLALSGAGRATDRNAYDTTLTSRIVFGSDGLRTEDLREDMTINSESAIQLLGQFKLTNNDHFHDLEILEMATIKPDGRRLDVPMSRVFTMSGSAGGAALFNAETTTRVIPFADVAVGDRLIVHIRRREKTAPIPGAVDYRQFFAAVRNAATVDITIDIPDSLKLYLDERGVNHRETAVSGGRRLAWRVTPAAPEPVEQFAVSMSETAPHIFLSNFKDWGAYGKNYGAQIIHAADPDATVTAKAQEVSQGMGNRRDVAKALFDWTSRNIRYFNVVLGNGGWFPHRPEAILALRYGDCKDHATLLRALLAAKGIDSEFVVINTGRIYASQAFPMPMFDHMIVYVPEFGRYLDPTDPTSTFDELPQGLRDKPVLRVAASGGIAARTPLVAAAEARLTVTSDVKIDTAGMASGTSSAAAEGAYAEDLRRQARAIATQGGAESARRLLAAQRSPGNGSLEAPSYLDHGPSFRITSTFKFDKPFSPKARMETIPMGPRLMMRPSARLMLSLDENSNRTFVCGIPRTYVEHLTLSWPSDRMLSRTPRNVDVHAGIATYHAAYAVNGNQLVVERMYRHSPAHAACEPSVLDEAADVIRAAENDFATKIALRPAPAPAPVNTKPVETRDLARRAELE